MAVRDILNNYEFFLGMHSDNGPVQVTGYTENLLGRLVASLCSAVQTETDMRTV